MTEPITIKPVALDDPRVSAVLEDAFPTDAEAKLVRAIAVDAPALVDGLSLGAFEGDQLLGYALFTRVWVGEAADHAVSLAPLAVSKHAQGRGLGKLLVLDGVRRARAIGESVVIVLGYPEYYAQFGFAPARVRGIEAPWADVPEDAWMFLELEPGAIDAMSGRVQFAAAFNEVV